MNDHDWGCTDISEWDLFECCAWLLFLLQTDKFHSRAYCAPFSRYVLTWQYAVPLNAIVIGQSPYPNDIFSEIAAAMSYNSELSHKCCNIAGDVPPTVKILANDLLIHAGLAREDTISVIKDGWALVEKGILLVNNSVFHDWRSVEGYRECVNQTTLILRLLEETEKHGSRTVQLFILAQRMASNICSWYKSTVVRISKKSVTHPAALSRRFDNLYDPNCHLGQSSFSVALAELLRNHVAFVHVMSRRVKENPALIRQADSLKHLANSLPRYKDAADEVAKIARELTIADMSDTELVKGTARKLADAMEILSSRTALLSSLISNAHTSTQNAAGVVSKAAPHEATIAPTSIPKIPPSRLSSAPVTFRKRQLVQSEAGESMATGVSVSSENPVPVTPVSSSKPDAMSGSAVRFRNRVASSTSTRSESLSVPASPSPVAFRPKSRNTTPRAPPNVAIGLQSENVSTPLPSVEPKISGNEGPLKMTIAQVRQLSCIESTLEILAPGALDRPEARETLEMIQHDIRNKVKYNSVTEELCEAIDVDLARDAKFDLSAEALQEGGSSELSVTLNKCKEVFQF